MPTYCTDADMLLWLGSPADSDFPSGFDTSAERAALITFASGIVDAGAGQAFTPSLVGSAYQRFPEITGTPPTPSLIEQITSMIAAVKLFQVVGSVNHISLRTPDLLQEAYDLLKMVRGGDLDVYSSTTGTTYGLRLPTSNVPSTAEHEYTVGQYDADGNLLSDDTGSLDGWTGGRFG